MRRSGFGAPCMVVAVMLTAHPAPAADIAPQVYHFNLPAQPLGSALRAFGQTCRQDIIFPEGLVRGKRSAPLVGAFTPQDGLRRLLTGTGITVRRSSSGILSLAPGPGYRTAHDDKLAART